MIAVENWLPVVGHEGCYEVSDLGRVRSLDRMVPHGRGGGLRLRKGQILRPGRKPSGHLSVALGKGNSADVHVLVLTAFRGPAPQGFWGLHSDDNPTNNVLSNLRWDTPGANLIDAVRNGRKPVGSRTRISKLTEADIPVIRSMFGDWSYAAIGREYGVGEATIRQIKSGRSWAHVEAV